MTFIRRSPRSAAPIFRRTGFVDATPRSERGVWIRQREGIAPLFAPFDRNPAIGPHAIDGAKVEFTLTTDGNGRPIATDVQPIRGAP